MAIFVRSRPNNADEYFKRFCLSIGYLAQNFARGRTWPHARLIVLSEGSRGVIEEKNVSPIANELRFSYSSFGDSKGAAKIEQVLEKCIKEGGFEVSNTDEATFAQNFDKSRKKRKAYTPPEALMLICQCLMTKELALTFDHFRLHRSSWRVLRAVNETVADDLKRIYSPLYLKRENQLPFVAGYIFVTAVQTKNISKLLLPKEDIVSSKLLIIAEATLESMIDGGMGGLEVMILQEKYGMVLEAENNDGDHVKQT